MSNAPTGGGLDIIREACAARRNVWASLSRDCGVSLDLIDAFAHGRADIPPDNLALVVDACWNGFIKYDAATDTLQAVTQAPSRSIGVLPTLNTAALPKFQMGPNQNGGPQRVVAEPKPKPKRGWLGGL